MTVCTGSTAVCTESRRQGPALGQDPHSRALWWGRERQWERLCELLDRAAASGGGGILLVEGPPGAGRSRLLADVAQAASARGLSVARGAADEVRSAVPLAPLASALGADLDAPADGGGSVSRLIGRLRSHVEERLRRAPTAVVIDDLQWADPATLAALLMLVSRFAPRPVVWVLARRAGAGTGGGANERLFRQLRIAAGAHLVRLGPLPDPAVRQIATEVLGAVPAPELIALADGADGNPAALVALVEGLTEDGSVHISDGTARFAAHARQGSPPRRFGQLVRERLGTFGPATRLLLDVAAVLGPSCAPDDLSHMLADPVASVLPALQEALDSRILVCDGDDVAFRHELVRLALLATIPPPVRCALHRQAADMILGRDGGLRSAATHLVHGARTGDGRAVDVLGRAAAEVVASEPGAAAELALRALEIAGPADPARDAVTDTAIEALTRAGPLPRAIALATEALTRPLSPPRDTFLRHWLSTALLLAGRADEAVTAAEQVLTGTPGAPRDEALANRAFGLLARDGAGVECDDGLSEAGGGAEGRRGLLAERLLDEAPRVPRDEALANRAFGLLARDGAGVECGGGLSEAGGGAERPPGRLAALAESRWSAGRTGEALNLAREAVKRADSGAPALWHLPPRLTLAALLCRLREADEAGVVTEALAEEVTACGAWVLRGASLILASRAALARGLPQEATESATAGLGAAEEAGVPLHVPLGLTVLAEAALWRGELVAAEKQAALLRDAARDEEGEAARLGRVRADWISAQVAAARADHAGVRSALGDLHGDRAALARLIVEEPTAAVWLIRAARPAGLPELADAAAGLIAGLAADNPGVSALLVTAAHARGVHEADAGGLRWAVDEHPDAWSRASAAEDLGTLRGTDDHEEAVAALDRAMAGYARVDAGRDAARVRRKLRERGVRRRHWTHADRPDFGWASLTATERSVAALVAQGLTNRQVATQMFLSPHTVGFHLRQIFRKLGIRSRVDLARMDADGSGSQGAGGTAR
ncbi:AAA family ATPase [Streptomyces sp. NPDC050658]|uniref:helix-turn-helix transcriptional regulator n=1 Tax=unclassified Streptomyces TaxID=2593676 RepID=UPI0034295298